MKTLVTKLAATMATAAIPLTGIVFADTHGFSVGVGYRQDSIQWDLEDSCLLNPTAESDLHFKDIEIFELGLRYKGILGCSLYARTSFDYGWIFDGSLREEINVKDRYSGETERFANNGLIVEGEYARAVAHNKERNGSYVWDFNIALGVPFDCWCDHFQIAPLIGFSYDRQNLKFKHREGFEISENISGENISPDFHGGSNKFRTSWWGPWVGFDFSYNCECVNIYGEVEIHWGRVERERNTSTDYPYFDDYKKTKSFWGPTFRLGSSYVVCECWFVDGSIGYKHWYSNSHYDTLDWRSADVRLDIGYIF